MAHGNRPLPRRTDADAGRGLHRPYSAVKQKWEPRSDLLMGSRRARAGASYSAYLPGTIAGWEPQISASVANLISLAEDACRRMTVGVGGVDLGGLSRQLLRSEAVASSRIEGLQISHRRLARAEATPGQDETTDRVVGNIRAMDLAVTEAATNTHITVDSLCMLHRELLAGTRDEGIGGLIRERQNWIGGEASSPIGAEFVPPPVSEVSGLLTDLVEFTNRSDIPPALQAAIAHAQFETIHPFMDGNGRVGRALIHVVLSRRGVIHDMTPPVSLALAAESHAYIAGLTSYRYGDAEDWFEVFARALGVAATRSHEFALDVSRLQDWWRAEAGNPRRDSASARLISLLPSMPVFKASAVDQALGISDEATRRALIRLEAAGVVRQRSAGKRNRVWECVGLFDLIDTFERSMSPGGHGPRPTRDPR